MENSNSMQHFFCPYGEALVTLDAIVKAQEATIGELRNKGYTAEEIEFLMR